MTDSHIFADELTEVFADSEGEKKNIGIVSSGSAAEHSLIGMLNFSYYDSKRKKIRLKQAGRGDASFLNDIGMENKGLEYSQYMSEGSLAQQGGFALTNKGPKHDEAWLIFMDMVNNQIPNFENKAEALHYFPIFRT